MQTWVSGSATHPTIPKGTFLATAVTRPQTTSLVWRGMAISVQRSDPK